MLAANFSIRGATIDDLNTLITLDKAIFGSYGGDEDPAVIAARLAVYPEGCAILEAADGAVAGYLTTEKWDALRDPVLNEDPAETHRPNGTVLNITTLAIVPEFQNRKLGPLLLTYAEQLARDEGCHQLVLETANARKWYERHGYTLHNERHQQGVHLFVMLKSDLSAY